MKNGILHFTIVSVLSVFCTAAVATEKILDYHSDITIFENAVMRVTETITVQAEGNKIRRGIYRDFPTRYKDNYGNTYNVDLEIEGPLVPQINKYPSYPMIIFISCNMKI